MINIQKRIKGVKTFFGSYYSARSVIITAGTFLEGRIWIGNKSMSAGRSGEQAAKGLTQNLHEIGIKTERLKTGTPARVDKKSIIFDQLDIQPSILKYLLAHIEEETNKYYGKYIDKK